ncbi:major facilitator superfamily transporter multidrug resistance [Colletotrichum incanum]|uniref:Major facilitator superfamily transporter multidrug resistance n=1 Tax=Colletotrichum incanum TaxID=1573173 RepID=A0A166QUK7_COLIC|nr:major facilitator superfamily transporter multidrug resistance [Colletotrichum incanum]
MVAGNKQEDSLSDSSSVASPPIPTSPATVTADETLGDGHGDVPWPGRTFHIIERTTFRAITIVDDKPVLLDLKGNRHQSTLWHCVEKNGYFGFQNPRSGRYIGHDSATGIRTRAEMSGWELWTPRQHPEGGYQLLSPLWSDALMVLCVAEDGIGLARRSHSTTLWEFIRV